MNRTSKMTSFLLILAIALGLLSSSSASAQWRTHNVPTSTQGTDLLVSPFKGPADAPVEIAVFSCFE